MKDYGDTELCRTSYGSHDLKARDFQLFMYQVAFVIWLGHIVYCASIFLLGESFVGHKS